MDLKTIQAAQKKIAPYIKKTPLIRCYALEEHLHAKGRIFFKCENLQMTNSFKPRGAFNALLNLSEDQRKRGVVTRSAGNFAQGLALAAQTLGIRAVIVMPLTVPLVKKEKTARYGAEIILHGKDQLEEQAKAQEIAEKENLVLLSPYDHADVIAGQGSIALEIFSDLPKIAHFFCPIGGGGLSAGTSTALKALNPSIQTYGIEPEGANDYFLSRKAGKRTPLEKVDTIADGLRAPQVGVLNWPLLEKNIDFALTVSDEEIKRAMRFLHEKVGMMIEPSGATSVAGLMFHPELNISKDAVCVLSGSNVDRNNFYLWTESVSL